MHGDWASRDDDGYWYLHGRSDDTLNIAGKRIGPAEVESVVAMLPSVAECAAVGVPDPVKGESVWVVVVRKPALDDIVDLEAEVRSIVREHLGGSFMPARVLVVRRAAEDAEREDRPARRSSGGDRRGPRRPVHPRGSLDDRGDQARSLSDVTAPRTGPTGSCRHRTMGAVASARAPRSAGRSSANRSVPGRGRPSTRSATSSPSAGPNLNAWPAQPPAITRRTTPIDHEVAVGRHRPRVPLVPDQVRRRGRHPRRHPSR